MWREADGGCKARPPDDRLMHRRPPLLLHGAHYRANGVLEFRQLGTDASLRIAEAVALALAALNGLDQSCGFGWSLPGRRIGSSVSRGSHDR